MDGEIVVDGQNVVALDKLGINLMAVEDKIIVMFDDYKSGYECKNCGGKGYTLEECKICDDTGVDRFNQPCKVCLGIPKSLQVKCSECKGKGGILVIPDTAKSLPTTGIVASMGPDTPAMKKIKEIRIAQENAAELEAYYSSEAPKQKEYNEANFKLTILKQEYQDIPIRLGSRIIFGPHVGTMIPFKGNIKLKIMRVHEPLAVLFGKDTAARDFIDYEVEQY